MPPANELLALIGKPVRSELAMIGLRLHDRRREHRSSVSRLPAAVPLRTRSSPGAPHRGGGLPASEPGLNAGTHDLLPTVTPAQRNVRKAGSTSTRSTRRNRAARADACRRTTRARPASDGRTRLASGDGGLLRSRTKVESASAKPRLAGRQPPPWWGAPGDDLARCGRLRASADPRTEADMTPPMPVNLVSRRHIDLRRTASAVCPRSAERVRSRVPPTR